MRDLVTMGESHHRRIPTARTFNELYDCARRLGTCEVVLELVEGARRRPVLALVVRCTDEGTVVQQVAVQSSVEAAAGVVRGRLLKATKNPS